MKKFVEQSLIEVSAFGELKLFNSNHASVRKVNIKDKNCEVDRFKKAKELSLRQLRDIYENALDEVGAENAQIFEVHMMMLDDYDYNQSIKSIINDESVNAEYAVDITSKKFAEMFESIDDPYMQARSADIKDISNRIINNLTDENGDSIDGNVIIHAEDIAPSEIIKFNKNIIAFITTKGSINSHASILAKSMDIPAIINIDEDFSKSVKEGDYIAINGHTGEVFINPDEECIKQLKTIQKKDDEQKASLNKIKDEESVTIDGKKIDIFVNIDNINDLDSTISDYAEGIGLFRSEFIYLESDDYPSEEQQFKIYKKILELMNGKKVIIRTLDIGADKQIDYFNLNPEDNPAMGVRGIRLCLKNPQIIRTQLRALYRASPFGNLGIMFPMITSLWEIDEIIGICDEVKSELSSENITHCDNVEIGAMIETPAAALISDEIAKKVDFISIGSNDLTQYTLACDRQNNAIDPFIDIHHEAILKLIEITARNANENNIKVSVCGELAADTSLTETLLKMGIDTLSVPSNKVLEVKNEIINTDLSN